MHAFEKNQHKRLAGFCAESGRSRRPKRRGGAKDEAAATKRTRRSRRYVRKADAAVEAALVERVAQLLQRTARIGDFLAEFDGDLLEQLALFFGCLLYTSRCV